MRFEMESMGLLSMAMAICSLLCCGRVKNNVYVCVRACVCGCAGEVFTWGRGAPLAADVCLGVRSVAQAA